MLVYKITTKKCFGNLILLRCKRECSLRIVSSLLYKFKMNQQINQLKNTGPLISTEPVPGLNHNSLGRKEGTHKVKKTERGIGRVEASLSQF